MYNKLPNYLTISRMLVIPLILLTMQYHNHKFLKEIAATLFALASITDFVDGYLARKFQVTSNFGKLFDPIADKLLVSSVLIVLVSQDRVDLTPALLIIMREIIISGLREFLVQINAQLPVSSLAKVKTGMQMTAITVLVMAAPIPDGNFEHLISILGRILIWISSILTIITGFSYAKICYNNEKI